MKLNDLEDYTRQYNPATDKFYRSGHGWTIYEAPHDIHGPVYLDAQLYDNPHARYSVGKELGVCIELVGDIAHKLYTPDGVQCKPNWFDVNAVVLCDSEHHNAIALTTSVSNSDNYRWWRTRSIRAIYASPHARPNGLFDLVVNRPDIKAGNDAMKRLKPFIGEAKLRAGLLKIHQSGHTDAMEELCTNFKNGIMPDMTLAANVALLINPGIDTIIRRIFRNTNSYKELVYEP